MKEPLLADLFALLDFDNETTADVLDQEQSLATGGNGMKPRSAPLQSRRQINQHGKAVHQRGKNRTVASRLASESESDHNNQRRSLGGYSMILPRKDGTRLLSTKQTPAADLAKGVVEAIRARESELLAQGRGSSARRMMDVAGLRKNSRKHGCNASSAVRSAGTGRLDLAGSLSATDAMIAALDRG
eukprot:SAG31_NODE_2123_length_6401_cov_4.982069_3_plen_187_part_00